jgi:hypothetical protein
MEALDVSFERRADLWLSQTIFFRRISVLAKYFPGVAAVICFELRT